jgi:site-specific DNA-cytosine methylase
VDDQQIVEAKGMRVGSFAQYVDDGTASPLRASGGDLGGGSENLSVSAYQTRADEKNGNFSINEADVANSLSALWPGDTSHRSMTLVAPSDPIISFPSAYSRQPTKFNDVADPLTLSAGAPAVFRKSSRAQTNEDSETWVEGDVANTLNSFDVGDVRTTHAIVSAAAFKAGNSAAARSIGYEEEISPSLEAGGGGNNKPTVLLQGANSTGQEDHLLLPVGLDSHRYRCCGNGVVASVAEWIGQRIVAVDVLD